MATQPFTWPNHERMVFGSISIWISFVDTFEQIIDYAKNYKDI